MEQVTQQDIADLIAGALDTMQLEELCNSLQKMENSVNDPNKKCEQIINLLRQGYFNWTGEQI